VGARARAGERPECEGEREGGRKEGRKEGCFLESLVLALYLMF
jgi:hypothetical protein